MSESKKCCECENDAKMSVNGGMAGYMHYCKDCGDVEGEEPADMTIYNIVKDMKVGDLTGTYYQTYGGGPEGGFFHTKDGWYELDRTWYQPWKVTKRPDIVVLFNSENNVPYSMRVIVC